MTGAVIAALFALVLAGQSGYEIHEAVWSSGHLVHALYAALYLPISLARWTTWHHASEATK